MPTDLILNMDYSASFWTLLYDPHFEIAGFASVRNKCDVM